MRFKAVLLILVISLSPQMAIAAEYFSNTPAAHSLEKTHEYRFPDGAKIKVHYDEELLKQSGESVYFAKEVLDAAVQAYQTITQFQGFSSSGYSFASPDMNYAYDPDKTIDIYLGSPTTPSYAFSNFSFKDSPCFDTVKLSEKEYQAVILLPVNYREFIKNWEKINPSSLGTRNVNVDLRGTLIHEMLHVILFYYNKNLNKDAGAKESGLSADPMAASRKVDWYVEGLARYFETFAGARHDFFSQGFKQTLPDKIRFSRGGSNYFMRYPDQAFTDLRYENALFWRFIDYRYGMNAIESLSRDFREYPNQGFERSLEKATQTPFKELLKRFAMSIFLKDFGLKDDEPYLKEIAKTCLSYKGGDFYLLSGSKQEKYLGNVCRTDWIGKWGSESARFEEPPVAGDNTEQSDVSGWATDYFEISLDGPGESLPRLRISHQNEGQPLVVQIVLTTKGGSFLTRDLGDVAGMSYSQLNLQKWVSEQGLRAKDIDAINLIITNTDPLVTANYDISANP